MKPKKTLITTYYTDVTDLSDVIIDLQKAFIRAMASEGQRVEFEVITEDLMLTTPLLNACCTWCALSSMLTMRQIKGIQRVSSEQHRFRGACRTRVQHLWRRWQLLQARRSRL